MLFSSVAILVPAKTRLIFAVARMGHVYDLRVILDHIIARGGEKGLSSEEGFFPDEEALQRNRGVMLSPRQRE